MNIEYKGASITVTKLVAIILAIVLIAVVISGVITGGLKPLEEKVETLANKVLLLFIKENPVSPNCTVYSGDCPGGCKRIDNVNITGDFSLCKDACYLVIDNGNNIKTDDVVYKYDYASGGLYLENSNKSNSEIISYNILSQPVQSLILEKEAYDRLLYFSNYPSSEETNKKKVININNKEYSVTFYIKPLQTYKYEIRIAGNLYTMKDEATSGTKPTMYKWEIGQPEPIKMKQEDYPHIYSDELTKEKIISLKQIQSMFQEECK